MEINLQPPDAQVRSFGRLWLPLFCLGVGGMALWRGEPGIVFPVGCAVVAALSFLGSFAALPVVRWIFIFLSLLVYPLAWVVQNLLLGGVYFLLVFPIGCFLRWRGHDPLRLRPPPSGFSAWKKPDARRNVRGYFRQY
jgi:hypothetical protein